LHNFVLFQGKQPIEMVGTFVNGLPEGHAKIPPEGQGTIIASFHKGKNSGLRRIWDMSGALSFVGFYQEGISIGKCW
jgi:antitoxin component YwqK of YwqJK toxin-antitoxin module